MWLKDGKRYTCWDCEAVSVEATPDSLGWHQINTSERGKN
jgi:hypothetical protein